jgi:methionyl-tRNA formyltransferase
VREPDLDPGVTEAELRTRCLSAGIAWLEVDEARSEAFLSLVRATGAGLLLSAAFPLVLPQKVLDAVGRGINVHPSLLPRCRGSHPIFWTLASGEREGGVTAHLMTREVDAGDVVAQIALPLTDDDTYASLYRRAMAASPTLVAEVEAFLREGREATPQEAARATRFREDREEDHEIRWTQQAPLQIVALVRTGQAFTWLRGRRLGISRARVHDGPVTAGPQGHVLEVGRDAFRVQASGGSVEVGEVVWRGRAHAAGPFARALRLAAGEVLA